MVGSVVYRIVSFSIRVEWLGFSSFLLGAAFIGMCRVNVSLLLHFLPVSSVSSVVLMVYADFIVVERIRCDIISSLCGSNSQTLKNCHRCWRIGDLWVGWVG